MIILVAVIIVRFVPGAHIHVEIQKHIHVLVVPVILDLLQEIVAQVLTQEAVAAHQLKILV